METPDARTAVLDDLEWRRMIADHTDLDALRAAEVADQVRRRGLAVVPLLVDEAVAAAVPDEHVGAPTAGQDVGPLIWSPPIAP